MTLPDEMCASAEADVGTPSTWHSSRHSRAALERVPSSWPCGTLRQAAGGRSVCYDVFVNVTVTGNVRCLCVRSYMQLRVSINMRLGRKLLLIMLLFGCCAHWRISALADKSRPGYTSRSERRSSYLSLAILDLWF